MPITDSMTEQLMNLELIQGKMSIETCKECPHFILGSNVIGCSLFVPDKNVCLILKEEAAK